MSLKTASSAIGLLRGETFVPLTNFTFKFVSKVTPPPDMKEYNGFMVEVSCSDGGAEAKGMCFFPWYKTQQCGVSIAKELGCAVPDCSLMSKLSPVQLKDVFWKKLMEFQRDGQGQIKKAVTTIGRQRDGETFVFGPTIQLSSSGEIIPDTAQEYEWVPRIIEQGSVIPLASGIDVIPECRSPLRSLLRGLQLLTQDNYIPGVFVLGSVIASLFYEDLIHTFGSCGVSIAIGNVNRGKSKSVELSLAALGLRGAKYSSISDALLRKLLLGAMPWCFDDPDDADQLQKILLSVFGGCTIGNITNHGATRVTPIATANTHILEDLSVRDDRILCRAKLIPFNNEVQYDLMNTTKINQAFHDAPAALPVVVHLGQCLATADPTSLREVMMHIEEAVPSLDSRLVMEYTLTVCSALVIATEVDEEDVSTEEIYDIFDDLFVPIIKQYQVRKCSSPLGNYLVSLAKSSPSEVLQVVNPYCSFLCGPNNKNTPGVAVILKELLVKLDRLKIEHQDEAAIRRQLRIMANRTNGVKTSANQFFLKKDAIDSVIDRKKPNTRNVSCVIIPRHDVPQCFSRLVSGGLDDSGYCEVDLSLSGSEESDGEGEANCRNRRNFSQKTLSPKKSRLTRGDTTTVRPSPVTQTPREEVRGKATSLVLQSPRKRRNFGRKTPSPKKSLTRGDTTSVHPSPVAQTSSEEARGKATSPVVQSPRKRRNFCQKTLSPKKSRLTRGDTTTVRPSPVAQTPREEVRGKATSLVLQSPSKRRNFGRKTPSPKKCLTRGDTTSVHPSPVAQTSREETRGKATSPVVQSPRKRLNFSRKTPSPKKSLSRGDTTTIHPRPIAQTRREEARGKAASPVVQSPRKRRNFGRKTPSPKKSLMRGDTTTVHPSPVAQTPREEARGKATSPVLQSPRKRRNSGRKTPSPKKKCLTRGDTTAVHPSLVAQTPREEARGKATSLVLQSPRKRRNSGRKTPSPKKKCLTRGDTTSVHPSTVAQTSSEEARGKAASPVVRSPRKRRNFSRKKPSPKKCLPGGETTAVHQSTVVQTHKKRRKPQYFCGGCGYRYPGGGPWIGCDGVYEKWFHFHCVGITTAPEGQWMCPKCRDTL